MTNNLQVNVIWNVMRSESQAENKVQVLMILHTLNWQKKYNFCCLLVVYSIIFPPLYLPLKWFTLRTQRGETETQGTPRALWDTKRILGREGRGTQTLFQWHRLRQCEAIICTMHMQHRHFGDTLHNNSLLIKTKQSITHAWNLWILSPIRLRI